jgi:hypothetical protein
VTAQPCSITRVVSGSKGLSRSALGGLYASGRCRNWLKVKNPAFERR